MATDTTNTDPTCHHCKHFFWLAVSNRRTAEIWCDGTAEAHYERAKANVSHARDLPPLPRKKFQDLGMALKEAKHWTYLRRRDKPMAFYTLAFYTLWPGCTRYCAYLVWDNRLMGSVMGRERMGRMATEPYAPCTHFEIDLARLMAYLTDGDPRDHTYPLNRKPT